MVSLFCLLESFIEHHIFKISNMDEIYQTLVEYSHSKFVDYFQLEYTERYSKFEDILVVLSKETNLQGSNYIAHVFDIDKEILIWVDKFKINTNNNNLREDNPIISIKGTTWMIVVDKSETKLYFVSDYQSDSSISINTAYKINVAYLSMENYLFISYMKSNIVPIYVLYFSKDEITEENKINVEFFREISFSVQYLIFDIDEEGLGLFFYSKNYIHLYSMKSAYSIEYIRQLPLFRYAKEYQFAYNSNVNDIVYIRYEGFLYVVFKHHINPVERYLMIYDLNDNTHNSLNKVISLSKSYFHTDLYLFAEKISTASTIFLYVFYGDDIYQFIKVEPDNILKREYNETGNLFLPKSVSDMPTYPPGNITLHIHPLYSPYTHYRNTTMVLNIN